MWLLQLLPLFGSLSNQTKAYVGLACVGGLLAFTFWVKHAPASVESIGNRHVVPTVSDWTFIKGDKQTDADVTAKIKLAPFPDGTDFNHLPELDLRLGVRANQVYAPSDDQLPLWPNGTPVYKVSVSNTIHRDWVHWARSDEIDIGTYAGRLSSARDGVRSFETGIRWSPIRFAADSISLDLVVGAQAAGGGVGLHMPPGIGPEWLRNIGIGYYRVLAYHDDHQRNLLALSFSIR